jgi:transposase
MNKQFYLNDNDKMILRRFHHTCSNKKTADKIKAILLIADGFSYEQIEKVLLIDERTIRRYKNIYSKYGIDGLTANNYKRTICKLTEEQITQLKKELDSKLYRTANEIREYILLTFNVNYTVKGLVQTLHRLGYSYKKVTKVPGKLDVDEQELFVSVYEKNYKNLPKGKKVYFIDGCHPTFNNHFGYGWIKTGSIFEVKSQDGRKRINLLGAYNPKDSEVEVFDYPVLNRDSVVLFLEELRKMNGEDEITIICDNARYMHAKIVKEIAIRLNIHIEYLPSYSPNLNLIERYWGFLKKRILINHYYESFDIFREAILNFAKNKSIELKEQLRRYIPEKFHLYNKLSVT